MPPPSVPSSVKRSAIASPRADRRGSGQRNPGSAPGLLIDVKIHGPFLPRFERGPSSPTDERCRWPRYFTARSAEGCAQTVWGALFACALLVGCGESPRDRLDRSDGGPGGRDRGGSVVSDARDDAGPDAGPEDGAAGDGGARCPPPGAGPAPGRVVTEAGSVRGVENGAAGWVYRGIPYAAPPTGARRWRAPQPPDCYDGVFDAEAFSSPCPQYDDDGAVVGREDCLTLNVWTPVGAPDGDPRPVLFWTHGGGHEQGSGSLEIYDGTALARDRDVVVVTYNYRLGPFGFLSHPDLDEPDTPSGNYGMRDQLAALSWVHRNIEAFGGDPSRVLAFGQSAGSVSTCRLVASPAASGLFHAAVLQSGACTATPRAEARTIGRNYAADAGCGEAADVRACLADRSTEALISAFEPLGSGTNTVGSGLWSGVIDGDLLPEAPRDRIAARQHNAVPIIVGSTREENGRGAPPIASAEELEAALRALYGPLGLTEEDFAAILEAYPVEDFASPRAAYVAITSDVRFTCPASWDASLLALSQSEPVYRYLFAHTADRGSDLLTALGAWHSIDLFFVFGTLETASPLPAGPGDDATTDAVQTAWTALARSGRLDGLDWPAWDGTDLRRFDDGARTIDDPRAEACDFWANLGR